MLLCLLQGYVCVCVCDHHVVKLRESQVVSFSVKLPGENWLKISCACDLA